MILERFCPIGALSFNLAQVLMLSDYETGEEKLSMASPLLDLAPWSGIGNYFRRSAPMHSHMVPVCTRGGTGGGLEGEYSMIVCILYICFVHF